MDNVFGGIGLDILEPGNVALEGLKVFIRPLFALLFIAEVGINGGFEDFIFAVAGEELGFVGTIIIILLLLFIVIECILIGRKAKDMSGRLICCGMAALVGFQSIFNIFVATGLMPNTGIPLPFVSYGLTSLVTLYMGMGFVLNVGLQPKKY